MSQPDYAYGFDGTTDDVSLVVMRRPPGGAWQVERTEGPDNEHLSRVVARIGAQAPRSEPQATVNWPEQIAAWMDSRRHLTWRLDDEQRALLARVFDRLATEGNLILRL